MNIDEIQAALRDIFSTTEALEKTLKLSGLVGALFRERDWEMVVVGGSAIEFYTEGQYMSGDIDLCTKTRLGTPPPAMRAEVMSLLGARGGPRSFQIGDRWIDILGPVERMSKAPFRELATPYGPVSLMPVEEVLVDKVFTSVYPQLNDEAKVCAEKLMAVCLRGEVEMDWQEAEKMAASKEYGVVREFILLRQEVEKKLSNGN